MLGTDNDSWHKAPVDWNWNTPEGIKFHGLEDMQTGEFRFGIQHDHTVSGNRVGKPYAFHEGKWHGFPPVDGFSFNSNRFAILPRTLFCN